MKTHCLCPHAWCEAKQGSTQPSPPHEYVEDQQTVGAWARNTFGDASPVDAAMRVVKEAGELVEAAWHATTSGNPLAAEAKAHVELADVLITLYRLADIYDVGIHKLVDEKMAINRKRRWTLDGRGGGQHIPEEK